MAEFFVKAQTFAAPFCSDELVRYIPGEDPVEAVEAWVESRPHPCGIYYAAVYANADDMHRGRKPLCEWKSNYQRAREEATKGKGCYISRGLGENAFEIDGEKFWVECPREGAVYV